MTLSAEVAKLRAWVAHVDPSHQIYPCWEFEYEGWRDLYSAAEAFLVANQPTAWSHQDSVDLLYAVARDNELKRLIGRIAQSPTTLLLIASKALNCDESDARCQVAAQLGELGSHRDQGEKILLAFVNDPDEYVSRRALLALGQLGSARTEELAQRAWTTGHEYQRIAALHALRCVGSDKLPTYIDEALQDGREHLVHNARQLMLAPSKV